MINPATNKLLQTNENGKAGGWNIEQPNTDDLQNNITKIRTHLAKEHSLDNIDPYNERAMQCNQYNNESNPDFDANNPYEKIVNDTENTISQDSNSHPVAAQSFAAAMRHVAKTALKDTEPITSEEFSNKLNHLLDRNSPSLDNYLNALDKDTQSTINDNIDTMCHTINAAPRPSPYNTGAKSVTDDEDEGLTTTTPQFK